MKTNTPSVTAPKPKRDYLFIGLMSLIGFGVLAMILRMAGLI